MGQERTLALVNIPEQCVSVLFRLGTRVGRPIGQLSALNGLCSGLARCEPRRTERKFRSLPLQDRSAFFNHAADRPRVLVNERFIIVRLKTKDLEHRIIDLKIQKHAIRYIADQIED